MHQLLGHLPFVRVYIDDVTIYSKTLEEHMEHLKIVINALYKAGLKLNREKCSLFRDQIKLLGYIISKDGISMDKKKVDCIVQRRPPENIKQIQEFFGLCGPYRRFIKDYAKISFPINDLLKSDVPFVWSL